MAKFTIAPFGQIDLDDIWHYISDHNEDAADKFMRDLAAKFQLLADNKEIGKQQNDFIVEMRMFPFKNYNIYYFSSPDGVEIYRIIHSSRDIESEFEGFFEGLPE